MDSIHKRLNLKGLALLGFLFVLIVLATFVVVNRQPNHLSIVNVYKTRMKAVAEALGQYAAQHDSCYPAKDDQAFYDLLKARATALGLPSPDSRQWLVYSEVQNRAEALQSAKKASASQVVYCSVRDRGRIISYFVLGKDEHNQFLMAHSRESASGAAPMVLHP